MSHRPSNSVSRSPWPHAAVRAVSPLAAARRGIALAFSRVCAIAVTLAAATVLPNVAERSAVAQDPWEYKPYRIHVWLALESVPELPSMLNAEIERAIVEQSDAAFGATWDIHVRRAPQRYLAELLYRDLPLPPDELAAAAKLGKQTPPKTADSKSADSNSADSKTADSKTADSKTADSKTADSKSADLKAAAATGAEAKTADGKTADGKTADATTADSKAADGKSADGKSADGKAEVGKAADGKSADGKSADGKTADAKAPATKVEGGKAADVKSEDADSAVASDPLVAELRAVFKSDKLLVASVTAVAGGWRVRARELDVRARRWTAAWDAEAPDAASLPSLVVAGLHASFLPLARIDYAQDKSIMTRLRAGALAVRGDEPVLVGEESLLRPWVRHNDRYGEPRPPLGVQAIPFSFLMVKKRDGGRLECEPHTGVRFPITGRNSARTERFALAVRAAGESTLVRLRTNEKPPQPLSGYDIFAKDPKSEKVELIGRTDWRGTMELPKLADSPLRVVYVKNGGSLLARLPTIPGHEPEMVVDLTPDDKRLQAEGFVAGVQAVLTDLVAQRELYAKRIRSRLSEGKINEAQKLLEEFKALPTRDDVQKLLDQQQPRITTSYKKVQTKIDKLFEDTRKLLYKFVDPAMAGKLEEEVRLTSEGKGPYAAALGAVNAAEKAVAPTPVPATPSAPPATAPAATPMPAAPSGM